jgi:hypothetical protein
MFHPPATLRRQRLEMLHPATVAVHRTLFNAHNPVLAADFELAVQGGDKIPDHQTYHHCLLLYLVTDHLSGTTTKGAFCGIQSIFCIDAPATSWSNSTCHIGLQMTHFSNTTFQKNKCPAVWMLL